MSETNIKGDLISSLQKPPDDDPEKKMDSTPSALESNERAGNLTKREKNHAKRELKKQRQAGNKPTRLEALSSAAALSHSDDSLSPPASPSEAGAVGGNGPPPTTNKPQPTNGMNFDDAVAQADADFSQNQQSNQTNQHKPTSQPKPQPKNPIDKYFQGDQFPRYLVIKHRDERKNIVSMNPFYIADGLKAVLSERQYLAIRPNIKYQFHSRLILVDVDGELTARKLLATKELNKIPVRVEVHKSKNTIKGTIYTSNFFDMSEAELLKRLTDQGVVDVFNIPKRDKSGKSPRYFLTFAGQMLPERILAEGLSIRVEAVKSTPRRCPKCQEFGHGEKTCSNNRVCCRCGQASEHAYKDCPNDESCVNCGQKHPASSPQCPVYQFEEVVIGYKTANNLTDTAARQHALRTHHSVETIPKLRKERENLPQTAAEAVARARGRPNPSPIQHNNKPAPKSDQPDISQLLKRLEDKVTSQTELLTEQSDLIKSQASTITQQASTIQNLQTCMLAMINTPANRLAFDGSLKDLQDRGLINQDQQKLANSLLTKSREQSTDSRKSRSRSRRPSTNSRDNRSTSNKSLPRGSKSRGPQDSSKKSPPRPSRGLGSLPSTPSKKRKADGTPGSPSSGGSSPASPESRPKHTEKGQARGKKANRDKSPVASAQKSEPLPSSSHPPLNATSSKSEEQPPPLAPPPLPPSAPPPSPPLSGLSLSVENLLTQERVMDLSGRNGEDLSTKSRAGTSPAYPVVSQDGTVKHVCRTSRKT